MSEPTPALAAALAKVQAELPEIDRDRTVEVQQKNGGTYSYSYVTLANLTKVVLPLLAKQGLSFVAMPGMGSDGKMAVRYSLMHESGERLDGEFPVSGDGGIQMIGGRITYARRYCLAAVVGIAADEDDESRLVEAPRPAQRAAARQRRGSASAAEEGTPAQRSAPAAPAGPPPLPGEGQAEADGPSKPQLAKAAVLFRTVGWPNREDQLRAASAIVGRPLTSSTDMTKAEASKLIDTLDRLSKMDDPAERLTDLIEQIREGGER